MFNFIIERNKRKIIVTSDTSVQSFEIRLVNCARNLNIRRSDSTYIYTLVYLEKKFVRLEYNFQFVNINIQHLKNFIDLYMFLTSTKETLNVRSFTLYCRLVEVFARLRFKSFSVVLHVHIRYLFLFFFTTNKIYILYILL